MEKRIVEVLKENGWEKIEGLINLKEGDIFRMSESDGTPVLLNGRKIMRAKTDAFISPSNNQAMVETEPYMQS